MAAASNNCQNLASPENIKIAYDALLKEEVSIDYLLQICNLSSS